MLEDMETWEKIWFYILTGGLTANIILMILFPKRGYFIFWYTVVFVLSGLPLLIWLGQAEIDGQWLWVEMSAWWFKATKKILPGSKELYKGNRRCMFIWNHSSLADIWLNDFIFEGRCSNLARHMVILFVPIPAVVVLFLNSIFFFRRGGNDLEKFFVWIDQQLDWFQTQRFHLNIFPEGHRNKKPYSIPLKRGMLTYAYLRKLLVQPVINFGIEKVLDEISFQKDYREEWTIEYLIGDVIDTKDFKTLDEFLDFCEKSFYKLFDRAHNQASEFNQRYWNLTDESEKNIFYSAPVEERSIKMIESINSKRKED